MSNHSDSTVKQLKPRQKYLAQRKALVDWLSGTGDSLQITNQAIHHSVLLLDLYATRVPKANFDIQLVSLASILVSSKFVQMRYPSADSLNSATGDAYTFDDIVGMEAHFLKVINWELFQYTVYDFIHLFLLHGVIFKSDRILGAQQSGDQRASINTATNIRKYAEFFADFCA